MFQVLKVVGEAKAGRRTGNDLGSRGRLQDPGNTKLKTICKTSLSDSEVDNYVRLGTNDSQGAEVSHYFIGLRALRDVSESGFLGERSHGADSTQADDSSWLFGSRLEYVHKFSDHVRRRVRDTVVKVRNDHIELELLGDGSSGKAHGGNRGENGEGKISKTKKKKRKSTAPKAEVPKDEDRTCSSKPELPQVFNTSPLTFKEFLLLDVITRTLGCP